LTDDRLAELNKHLPRWLGASVLAFAWLALLRANWGFVLQEIAVAAVMAGLLAVYFWLVWQRRNLASAIHRQTGLAAFEVSPEFVRDIDTIALDPLLRQVALWLAGITLAVFIVTGFADLGDTRPVAVVVAVAWIVFSYWAAERIK